MIRMTLSAVALVCLVVAAPAHAQVYGTISAEVYALHGLPAGALVEIVFWVELDDRGGMDSGLAGMDLTVSWDPAKAILSNESAAELWVNGVYLDILSLNLDSDGDWLDNYYTSDPPGDGVQFKITDTSTDTYVGPIWGLDGVAGTNLWPNKFEVTPGAGSVFFQGYQDTPADFSLGSQGSAYPFAHMALVFGQDLSQTGLCLNLQIDTLGQLNSPTNTVDRILFDMTRCPGSPFPNDQEVSIAAGQINEFELYVISEPSVFLLAALGLPALLGLRRRRR